MQNDMRDRLVGILKQECDGCQNGECSDCPYYLNEEECFDHWCKSKADELIANGVILSPCKIGDIVYVKSKSWHIESDDISSYQITNLTITQNKKGIWTKKYRAMYLKNGKTIDSQINFEFDDIGKTVFLTREEAEKKLEEMKK